jgi:hypothetical protein
MYKWAKYWVAALVLVGVSLGAHAQRSLVPVVDFKNIPVATGDAARKLSADQVRQAIMTAAAAERWDITPVREGVLLATYRKGDKHRIDVEISYDAQSYSVVYKDSYNMRYTPEETLASPYPRSTTSQQEAWARQSQAAAAQKQAEQFADKPESAQAVVRKGVVIHPFYERWVRVFIDGVNRQLKINP